MGATRSNPEELPTGTTPVMTDLVKSSRQLVDGSSRYFSSLKFTWQQIFDVLQGSPLTKLTGNLGTAGMPALPATGRTVVYTKGAFYVIAYNDGGTVKYRYLDQTTTAATWQYSTTAP